MRTSPSGHAKTQKLYADIAADVAAAINAAATTDADMDAIAQRAGLIGTELTNLFSKSSDTPLAAQVSPAVANTILGGLANPDTYLKTTVVAPPYCAKITAQGTATAGASTSLTDSGASFTADQWIGSYLTIKSGTGKGQRRLVVDNTTTAFTVTPAWDTNPDTTSVYYIENATGVPAPQLSGNTAPQVGQTFTRQTGVWIGDATITYAFRWLRRTPGSAVEEVPPYLNYPPDSAIPVLSTTTNPAVISGQTGTTYVLASGDVGKQIGVEVTATNAAGSKIAVSAFSKTVIA